MHLLEHTATIRRWTSVGTNGRKTLSDLASNVACLALPMSDSTTIRHNFTLGRAYDIFFADGQDVRKGDQVVIGSDKYTVRHTQVFKVFNVGHVRALCEMEIS